MLLMLFLDATWLKPVHGLMPKGINNRDNRNFYLNVVHSHTANIVSTLWAAFASPLLPPTAVFPFS